MASQKALKLRLGATKMQYRVHPVVVFSILDHYKRRSEGQHRVVGTLLGQIEGDVCFIKNCFPDHHVENEDKVVVDMEYHNSMLNLHQRICNTEVVVGWYSTGDEITYTSSLMHDAYKARVDEPLLLTVDTNVRKFNRLALKGYIGKSINILGRPSIARFQEVPLDIRAYEGEKIAIDALINGTPDNDNLDAPATILSDMENLEASLEKLSSLISIVSEYVSKVKDGSIEGDEEIGMAVADAVAVIPHLNAEAFEKMFEQNVQDLLMVLYLANLTRTHLALADRINGLL